MLGDGPSLREGPLSSGGLCEERRGRFNGGAGVGQSIWVVGSCFSKILAEPSEAGSVALTVSASGKSCVVAQKVASYSPNACSRVLELSLNGDGAPSGSLG